MRCLDQFEQQIEVPGRHTQLLQGKQDVGFIQQTHNDPFTKGRGQGRYPQIDIFICNTDLDPAILRAGRFDLILELEVPDLEARKKILAVQIEGRPVSDRVNVDEVAEGLSSGRQMLQRRSLPPI